MEQKESLVKKGKTAYIQVKDHSVSGELFELIENKTFGFLETQPQPSLNNISRYYDSEDYISHTNTRRNLFEKAYHAIRSISLKRKLKLINSFNAEEKKILDIGCGTGAFLKMAKDNGWQVSGIEPNQNARTIANQVCNNNVFTIEALHKFKANSFDVITLWHVLEHLPNLE